MYSYTYLCIVQLLVSSLPTNFWGVLPLTRHQFKTFIIVESLEDITINYDVKQLRKILVNRR